MRDFFCCCAVLLPFMAFGQSGIGSWNTFNVRYNVSNRFSVFGEAQLRSLKFYADFHYYEYKGGIQYRLQQNVTLAVGAGSYQTYAEGGNFKLPKNNDELRLWPQLSLTQTAGKLKIEQRYRAELRFTNNGYRNRFRYRASLSYPLGKPKKDIQLFTIGASNELFFTNREPYFERNRLQFTLNVKPSVSSTIQLGYLHQFDYRINDETGRDFLQIGYFLELGQ